MFYVLIAVVDIELDVKSFSMISTAIENHPEVVRILLEAGANPNVYDHSTWNPHEHAIFAANNACAALLRPVSCTLDERQKMQKANGDFHQGSPTQTTVDRLAGSTSPQFQRPDSPPASGGRNHVKASKAVHRAYGHKYLEDESLILVTLGSNDIRSTVEPIELFHTESSNSLLTASTAFSLEITSENATAGERVIIDLPLKDSSYHDQIVFYASNPEDTILNFSVFPTFGNSTGKIIGRGTAMLSSLDNLRKDYKHQHPSMTPLQGMNMTVPIFGTDSMTIIGRVRVEFSVVRPFKHENLKVGSKHTYWKSLTTTVSPLLIFFAFGVFYIDCLVTHQAIRKIDHWSSWSWNEPQSVQPPSRRKYTVVVRHGRFVGSRIC